MLISLLWVGDVVAFALDDLPDEHHRVIFVDDVVAVERILADEIAEPEERLRMHVVLEPDDVFATVLHKTCRRRRRAIDREELKLLEVDVRRMLPTSRTVRDDPVLDRILRDSGPHFLTLRIHRAAIDGPVAVRAIEVER